VLFVELHTQAFGHFVVESELLLKKAQAIPETKILFYRQKVISNTFWWKQVQRHCTIVPRILGFYCDRALSKYFRRYRIDKEKFTSFTLEDYKIYKVHESKEIIHFTKKEIQNGEYFLRNLELANQLPLIGVCLRDSAYDETFGKDVVDAQLHRNIDTKSSKKVIQKLIQQDTNIIRFGNANHEIIPTITGRYIDLGILGSKKESFLSFFLASKVNFFVSTGTGVDAVACALRKRIYTMNNFPIGTFYPSNLFPLYLPQDYTWSNSGRKLSFAEIFNLGIQEKTLPDLKKLGIEIRPKLNEVLEEYVELVIYLEQQLAYVSNSIYDENIKIMKIKEFARRFNLELVSNIVY
jgi:putative glycosyltransferase (TIGR04372 family)